MKLAVAKRHLVNAAIAHAKRVTTDVTRLAAVADEYIASARRTARRDGITVIYAAATHIEISRSAGTSYKQLRKLYPPMPEHKSQSTPIIPLSAGWSPPASNTGETFTQLAIDTEPLGEIVVDGRPVRVLDVLEGYV